jgi:prepilin-type N-terminal cleavage/methylation domain-containing protein
MPMRVGPSSLRWVHPLRLGFTLVELLVVIGIIVVLVAILLPSLAAANHQARVIKCESNLRQIGIGFLSYSMDNHGNYSPNTLTPPQYWYDADRVLRYINPSDPPGTLGFVSPGPNSVFVCPEDDSAICSYSMNVWASCKVDKIDLSGTPPVGQLWPHQRKSTEVILLSESWSYKTGNGGFQAQPTIGYQGSTAAQRFGAGAGITPYSAARFGMVNCELAFQRHRTNHSAGTGTQPIGRVNICFDDGHVALCSQWDLYDPNTGQSTGLAAWSPLDFMR